ncbi:Crp/Fnr family transcriptional regulator [Echinicola vietnamensis]|uniref:cAMP-binding protein n=1 Tax=Echinicola vietnamensis (strain DSM 17526 / LMG 23754 / KMM 6221) TaxID=926556 RepID=L0FZV4_ECHVK|nr:Crp/Fnr family transcriptional regulator [Echinicola vietnamensis]AGA78538.1 cAMP-binding protein [Echinicola vietnamensis DSM 17526]
MEEKRINARVPTITDVHLLDEMERQGTVMNIAAGKTIMEPGKFIKTVPIVLEGAIKVLRMDDEGKELFLYYLYPGETCALSLTCCEAGKASEIKAIVEEDTKVLLVPVQYHEQWYEQYKQWKDFVTATYQKRFQEMLKVLDSVAFLKMDQRLARYLVTKMKKNDTTALSITHQEIANELGTSREVISRLLKQLEKKKWIELGRNKIFIRDDFEELAEV